LLFYLVSCNFSHLVPCLIGLETWIPKGGQRVLSFTAKVTTGFFFLFLSLFFLFLFFPGSFLHGEERGQNEGFRWVRFFQVGVGWIWARSAGKEKFARIPVLDPWAFNFFHSKSGVSFHSSGSGICHVSSRSLRRANLAVLHTTLVTILRTTILWVFYAGLK